MLSLLRYKDIVCLAKNSRLVLNEVKPNIYLEYICKSALRFFPILVCPDLVGAIMLACWTSLHAAPTYKKPRYRP
ncbi:hypothetical protein D3C81_433810 [compost metagenome]